MDENAVVEFAPVSENVLYQLAVLIFEILAREFLKLGQVFLLDLTDGVLPDLCELGVYVLQDFEINTVLMLWECLKQLAQLLDVFFLVE